MPGPKNAGILFYAKDVPTMTRFYEAILGMSVVHQDEEHAVLSSPDTQVIIHAIPADIAAEISVVVPPLPREAQAIKPFFTVENLAVARDGVVALGGLVMGREWPGPGFVAQNVCDPEGNIVHLRASTASQEPRSK